LRVGFSDMFRAFHIFPGELKIWGYFGKKLALVNGF
jgi:hypothetical protein